ncbi:MAG: winged helix-turn-helix domain-containing protein [Proteobacteria bacterium]|nr:winged helix-turn-helix domain-containing protein [Pseudomonadota bacterium]
MFDLIVYLVVNKHKVITRDELFQKVWQGREVLDATLSNHIKNARSAIGDNGQSQHSIKTIHGRGYQFIADVLDMAPKLPPRIYKKSSHYKTLGVVVLVLLVFTLNRLYKPLDYGTISTIAVLPFTNNQPSQDSDYFSFAIADQIIGHLNYLQNISVRPSASVRKFVKIVDPIAIGQQLGVDYILTGSYLKLDNTIRLTTELIEVNTSNLIWRGEPIEVENQNIFELQDIVAQKVLNSLKIKFSTTEIQRISSDVPSNPLAYEYYLRSIAYPYTVDGNKLAVEMLKRSLELDPQYALTYAHLGNRIRRIKQYSLQDLPFQNAEDYYLKALKINPDLLSALSYLALLYTETNRIEEAVKMANIMLDVNPNNADTHFTLGYIYRYAGMVDEAITRQEQAVRLDPLNPKYRSLISTYSGAGKYHKALKMIELYEKSPFTQGWKGLMNFRLGNNEKAIDYFNQAIQLDKNGLWANVAIIFKSHIADKPEAGFQAIKKLSSSAHSDGETLYFLSSYYALLGDKENSLNTLEKAINAGYFNYSFMASNSYYDSFQNNSSFKKLLMLAQNKHIDFKERYF